MSNHFGLTFLVQGIWYKSYVAGQLTEEELEKELIVILDNYTEGLTTILITKEYSRKGNVPHYHVYLKCNSLDLNEMKLHWVYGKYIWCNELQNKDHYTNYILKYYKSEKMVYLIHDPNDKEVLTMLYKHENKNKKSIIERFVGMNIKEYIENDIRQFHTITEEELKDLDNVDNVPELDKNNEYKEEDIDEDYGPPY